MHTAALLVGGPARLSNLDGLFSGAAMDASRALRTARYTTAQELARPCPELGTNSDVRTAMSDGKARARLL